MGLRNPCTCRSSKLSKFLELLLHWHFHLVSILNLILSHLPLLPKSELESDMDRPSPSLVPLPLHILTESLKKTIPVTHYMKRDSVELCVVCLDVVEVKDEIRELSNCSHVFHLKCLDAWIAEGHLSCPLCRVKLVSDYGGGRQGEDPWRKERMVYLFGEDYHFTGS